MKLQIYANQANCSIQFRNIHAIACRMVFIKCWFPFKIDPIFASYEALLKETKELQ